MTRRRDPRPHRAASAHEFAEARSLILPALKFAQTEKGHLTPEDLAAVAEATGFSPAYVESVASFYDRLYLRPTGAAGRVGVRDALVHAARLGRAARAHLRPRGPAPPRRHHARTALITVQEAQCLGYCDRAPVRAGGRRGDRGPLTLEDADAPARRAALSTPAPSGSGGRDAGAGATSSTASARPGSPSRTSPTTARAGGYAALCARSLDGDGPRRGRSTRSCARACAAAAAPASRWAARRASSPRSRRCPPTSCATPTRASPAPSRTAS